MEGDELHFKKELDLMNMSRFGKSAKHSNCIEVFIKLGPFETKHKFKFLDINEYVAFMKYLDKFTMINFANQTNQQNGDNRDSIESVSVKVMNQKRSTLNELQHARLYMTECPKGKAPPNFEFPDC